MTVRTALSILLVPLCLSVLVGIPLFNTITGDDANFALHLISLYRESLASGHFLPDWSASGNNGYGSPVFFFYGFVPSLLATICGAALHLPASLGLALALALARLLGFFTSRLWLKLHFAERQANWGALLFVTLPAVSLLNPVVRVAAAESVATALLPLLFFFTDRAFLRPESRESSYLGLSLTVGVLVFTHLPQTILGLLCIGIYAFLRYRWQGFLFTVLSGVTGLLLGARFLVPALTLQKWTAAAEWSGDWFEPGLNMLFSPASILHARYRLFEQICLHLAWLISAAFAVVAIRRSQRDRAVWLLVGLLAAMTYVGLPLWQFIGPLHRLQFPWRLLPLATLLTGYVAARMSGEKPALRTTALLLGPVFTSLVLIICGIAAFAPVPPSLSKAIGNRILSFVPWTERDLPQYAAFGSNVPEYIPLAAIHAGWSLYPPGEHMLRRDGQFAQVPSVVAALQPRTTFLLHEDPQAPQDIVLHQFAFPGWTTGPATPGVVLTSEAGLLKVHLPPGTHSVAVGRTTVREKVWGLTISALGILVLLWLGPWLVQRINMQSPYEKNR